MPKKIIHNAQTGEITEISISELDLEREKLGLSGDANQVDIQAERQRREGKEQADIQEREQRAEQTTDKLLERIEALEAEINKRNNT